MIPKVTLFRSMINSMNTTFWVQADLEGMGFDQATHIINNTKSGDTLVMLKAVSYTHLTLPTSDLV